MNERTRFWDRNWELVYDSLTTPQEPEEFLREHDWLNCTVDTTDGRWAGRWINTNGVIEKHHADEHLTQIQAWANPFITPERQFPRQEGWTWVDVVNAKIALDWRELVRGIEPHLDHLVEVCREIRPTLQRIAEVCDPDVDLRPPRADGKPHPPRPSRTPPMWAIDASKQKRRR